MSDLNNFSGTGRLGNPPELKYTQSGTAVLNFSMAVGYGYGENAGTNWLRVSVFGKQAESLGKLELAKGTQVAIAGELRVREYTTNDGVKGTSVEVNAREVVLLGKRPDSGNNDDQRQEAAGRGAQRQTAQRRPPDNRQPEPMADDDFMDDQIPF